MVRLRLAAENALKSSWVQVILKKIRIAWRAVTTAGATSSCRERRLAGDRVGFLDGARVGFRAGVSVGFITGEKDGDTSGDNVGFALTGVSVGLLEVGAVVGALLTPPCRDTISARTLED